MKFLLVSGVFLAIFVGFILQNVKTGDIADIYANVLSYYVSPKYTIALGKAVCDLWAFFLLPIAKTVVKFDQCFDEEPNSTVKVLIATPKGGVAFAGKLFSILNLNCGIRAGISNGIEADWPDVDSYPSKNEYDLQYMLAYATDWESYYEMPFNKHKKKQCVVLTRNPFDRLVSLYSYTKDGTEYGLREHSKNMKALPTVKERLDYLWETLGEKVMTRSQPAMVKALELNCTQVFSDKLFKSSEFFAIEMNKIFKEYGIREGVQQKLYDLIKEHDLSNKSEKNFHASGRSLEANEKEEVRKLIKSLPHINDLLVKQSKELNY